MVSPKRKSSKSSRSTSAAKRFRLDVKSRRARALQRLYRSRRVIRQKRSKYLKRSGKCNDAKDGRPEIVNPSTGRCILLDGPTFYDIVRENGGNPYMCEYNKDLSNLQKKASSEKKTYQASKIAGIERKLQQKEDPCESKANKELRLQEEAQVKAREARFQQELKIQEGLINQPKLKELNEDYLVQRRLQLEVLRRKFQDNPNYIPTSSELPLVREILQFLPEKTQAAFRGQKLPVAEVQPNRASPAYVSVNNIVLDAYNQRKKNAFNEILRAHSYSEFEEAAKKLGPFYSDVSQYVLSRKRSA